MDKVVSAAAAQEGVQGHPSGEGQGATGGQMLAAATAPQGAHPMHHAEHPSERQEKRARLKKAKGRKHAQDEENAPQDAAAQDTGDAAQGEHVAASGHGAPEGAVSHLTLSSQSAASAQRGGEGGFGALLGVFLFGGLAALSGGGGGGGSEPKVFSTGFLIDSPVAGVDYYLNGVLTGKTAQDGSFTYAAGDRVTFKIGTITLGDGITVGADGKVFMQDLAGVSRGSALDPKVLRLAQLLQSLDADNNPDNGITIDTSRLRDNLPDTVIDGETKVETLLKPGVTVVKPADALDHLNDNSPVLKGMDDTAPTATIRFDAELLAAGETAQVTVTFSEKVTLWADWSDLVKLSGGGTLSDFKPGADGLTYTATYTPPAHATGEVSFSLSDDFTDLAGNRGDATTAQVLVDTEVAQVRIDLPLNTIQLENPGLIGGQASAPDLTAIGADGSYVAVWQGTVDGATHVVMVQRFAADGSPLGAPVTLSKSLAPESGDLAVSVVPVGSAGGYMVSYQDVGPDGQTRVFVQRFDADGVAQTRAPVALAGVAGAGGADLAPQIVPLGETGGFALLRSVVDGAGRETLTLQRFSATGVAQGAAVAIPAGGAATAEDGVVTALGHDGSYALSYVTQDADGHRVVAVQSFAANGTPKGDVQTLRAPGDDAAANQHPRLVALGDAGGFAVLWDHVAQDGTASVYLQAFGSDGAKTGEAPLLLAGVDPKAGGADGVSIAPFGDKGDFVLAYVTKEAGGDTAITVQKFAADGRAFGAAQTFEAADGATGADGAPKITAIGDKGDFALAWSGQDGKGASNIYVQRFNADGVADVKPQGVAADDVGSHSIGLTVTEPGAAYLVHAGVDMSRGLAALTGANGDLWNSVTVTAAGAQANLSTAGLKDGSYVLYTVDAHGNLSAPVPGVISIDQTRPVLTITDSKASGTANGAVTYTFTFSEAVSDFSADDVTVLNGTKGVFTAITEGADAGKRFTLVVTPPEGAAGADIGLSVGKDWTDRAGNAPEAVTVAAAQGFDRINPDAPEVALKQDTGASSSDTITRLAELIVKGEPGARFQYSTNVSADYAGDFTDTPPAAVEGLNTVYVRQIDAAGNVSASQTFTYTLDTKVTAPSVALETDSGASATDLVTNTAVLKVVASEGGSVVEYSTDQISWSATAPGPVAGSNTVYLRQTDTAGNVATTSITYTYDAAATKPGIALDEDTGTDTTDGITRIATINVTGLETGATWEYRVDGTGDWIAGSGTSFKAGDGAHSYEVRQTDKAGNTATSDALDVTLVTEVAGLQVDLVTAANVPIIGTATNDTTARLRVAKESTDTAQYRLVDATNQSDETSGWQTVGADSTINLGEGTFNVQTRKIDIAGNFVELMTRVTKDTEAKAPKMTLVEDTGTVGDGLTTNPMVKIGGLEAYAKLEVKIDDATVWGDAALTGGEFRLLSGTHKYYLRQTDRAGNVSDVSEYTFTYQSDIPSPVLKLASDTGLSDADFITQGTVMNVQGLMDGASWQYRKNGGDWVTGTGSSFVLAANPAGDVYEVRQSVGGKFSEPSAAAKVVIDTSAPGAISVDLQSDSGSSGSDGITNESAVIVSGLDIGTRLQVRVDGGEWRGLDVTAATQKIEAEEGTHTYDFRQIDAAGNASAIVTKIYTYLNADVAAPSLALANDTGGAGDGITSDKKINVSLTQTGPGVRWQYEVDGSGTWIDGTGTSFDALAGQHSYKVRQLDVAGNTSDPSAGLSVTLDTQGPSVSGYVPVTLNDSDSEGPNVIPTTQVLHTVSATDATNVRYSMAAHESLSLDPVTGKITFKQPTGYIEGGTNTYSTTVTVTDAAGNTSSQSVNLTVTRTNMGAPQVNLGDYKTGMTGVGNRNGATLLSDGTAIFGDYAIIGNAYVTMPKRMTTSGGALNSFVLPSSTKDVNGWVVDGQDRLYVLIGTQKSTVNTSTYPVNYTQLQVVRFEKDGTLDTSYGTGGAVVINADSGKVFTMLTSYMAANNLDIRADGRLVLAVTEGTEAVNLDTATTQARVMDLAPDGAVNNSFLLPRTGLQSYETGLASDVAQGTDGVVYVLDQLKGDVRKFVSGVLDTTYNNGAGKRTVVGYEGYVIEADAQNRLMFVTSSGSTITVTRLKADGTLDTSFGTAGKTVLTMPASTADMALEYDPVSGKIFVVGSSTAGDMLFQLLPTGAVDASFANNGALQMPVTGYFRNGLRTAGMLFGLQYNDGKLMIYGEGDGGTENGAATRLVDMVAEKLDDTYGKGVTTTTEGSRPVGLLTGRSLFADIDLQGKPFDGFSVTVQRQTGPNAADVFGTRGDLMFTTEGRVLWKGQDIGSVSQSAGFVSLRFNANATAEVVNDALRGLTYRNSNPFQTGEVNLAWVVNDGDKAGSKTTTAILTVNIRNDNADVGDQILAAKSNDVSIDLNNYFTVGGKKYYMSVGTTREKLDGFFAGGEDTSDTARTAVLESGITVKMLTQAELTALWAQGDLPNWANKATLLAIAASSPAEFHVATATGGATADTHVSYNLEPGTNAFQTVTDSKSSMTNYVFYEVIESPDPQPDFVDPSIRLVVDNGDSTADRLTSDGRFELLGMNPTLDYEVSGDGGKTWTTKSAGNLIFEMPAGRYEAGQIVVRQTDSSGFTDTVRTTAQFRIDKTIKSLGLANDQGLSFTDSITADGTIVLNGIDPTLPYDYSLDGGLNWKAGGTLASGAYGFVLPTGSYGAGMVRIRQTDADGATSSARNSTAYVIDPLQGQGDIKLAWDNGLDPKDGVTSYEMVNVTGLKKGFAFDVSTDGGKTWVTQAATTGTGASFAVPEGSYAAGDVRVRQTDDTGYRTEIGNRGVFAVDKSVKTIALLNDQGTTIYDNVTADARVVIKGLNKALPYQYSVDGGANWLAGTKVGDELVVSLGQGVYGIDKLQARQTDGNGLTTFAKNTQVLTISDTKGQGSFGIGYDSGVSNSDGITTYRVFSVSGLRDSLPWQYSLDGGQTWTDGTLVKGFFQTLTLPDGSYGANAIQLKQTDATGFTTYVKNSAPYVVDNAIATPTISLVADTGYSNTDKLTADGRITISLAGQVGADDKVQYTLDGGATWIDAAAVATQTITLANGSYGWGNIRVKVSDKAGNANAALLRDEIRVDNTDTTAPVITSSNVGFALDRDGTAKNFGGSTVTPSLVVKTTDANQVYYSLSGSDAGLFNISGDGRITFKTLTQLVNPLGDSFALTVTATDAFGNASTQDVTINLVDNFYQSGATVGSYWDPVETKTFDVRFSHKIALNSGAVIKLVSVDGSSPDIVLDTANPAQVSVSGNTLTLNIEGVAKEGRYKIAMNNAVKSVLTNEVFAQSEWSDLGFAIDRSVTYADGKLSSRGSFVVGSADGVSKGGAAILGDVNGDGIDDWAMSAADGDSAGRSDNGKIYVVYGTSDGAAPNLSAVAGGTGGYLISGPSSGAMAGMTVANAGDVNNDGLQDIAIHASGGDGAGYIVYGRKTGGNIDLGSIGGNTSLGRVFTNSAKDSFGAIGDVNGDGFDDVAHGRVDLQRTTVLKRVETSSSSQVVEGKIVMKADWLNFVANWVEVGVKIADFIDDPLTATIENAAEWQDNLELAMGGEDRLDPDSPNFDPVAKAMLDMTMQVKNQLKSNQTLVGWDYVKSGGDSGGLFSKPKDTIYTMRYTIKSDIETIYTTTTTLFGAGETIVEYGGPSGATKKITGTINGQQVGTEVVALGDINGDGRADFGVLDTGSGGVLARMNVVFGSKSTEELFTNNFDSNVGGFRIMDPARSVEYVGEGAIAGLGDVNGDGINDFSVTLDSVEAASYIVYGRAGMTGVDLGQIRAGIGGYMLTPAAKYSTTFVDAIGDFNGDGLDDFVYYSVRNNATSVYDMFVVYGAAGNLTVKPFDEAALVAAGRGFAIEGANSSHRFANTNAVTAGDINGDGLSDLMLRGANGETVVLMGSATSGRNAQVQVDQMGTAGADTFVSTGTQLLVGGLGRDTITTKGADVVWAGAGDDRVILDATTLTALQSNLGAGGNLGQLAKIDGGAGVDTLQLSGGMTLDLRLISNKMMDLDNINSRLANIEHVDMASDSAANTLRVTLSDVLDMGSSNVFNTGSGWQNMSGGDLSSMVAKTQFAVTAGSNDRVELRSAEWTATGGTVRDTATGQEYNVYAAQGGVAAQILIDKDAIFGWV